jgi:hypothetical protein
VAVISMKIPEEMVVDALSNLPYEKRMEICRKVSELAAVEIKCIQIDELDKISGIVSLGGDAVLDSENIFDA